MVTPEKLQKYSLFGGLLAEQIEQILPHVIDETYSAGDEIITEGAPNDKIRFILEGKAAAVKHGVTLYEFGEGDTFGEMEVLDVMPSVATIRALSDIKAISISNRALHDIYKADLFSFSLIIMNLARDLSRRLRRMDDKVAGEAH